MAACQLFDTVWEVAPDEVSEVQPALLRALAHTGHYLVGAYTAAGPHGPGGDLVGASVAFFGEPLGKSLHSHITGVLPDVAGTGVGTAIKWHQRGWSLARGLDTITWTYDPLIARNAYFNVTRLGARPTGYLTDFYGEMRDGPNRGQPTDRVHTVWSLTDPATLRAAAAVRAGGTPARGPDAASLRAGGASVLLAPGPDGAPVTPPPDAPPPDGGAPPGTPRATTLIGIPRDIELLRRADQPAALAWRMALRAQLAPLLAGGRWVVDGFARDGWYVLRPAREPEGRHP